MAGLIEKILIIVYHGLGDSFDKGLRTVQEAPWAVQRLKKLW